MAKKLTNDQVLLEQVVKQKHKEFAPEWKYADYFEFFVAEQILKDFDLDSDDLQEGIVGKGGDGGTDGFYVFIDDEICRENTDFTSVRKSAKISVFIIQSKTSKKFEESALIKLNHFVEKLTDLSLEEADIDTLYHVDLVEKVMRFQKMVKGTAAKYPKFEFNIFYASLGDEQSEGIAKKAREVESRAREFGKDTIATCSVFGARQLQELARREPVTSFTLDLAEAPLQQQDSDAVLCLVRLPEYNNFISDENGKLRRTLFEDNVRDYQGVSVEVNKAIAQSLKNSRSEDFWWLNNGITILCQRATPKGRTITIEAPQIVNGFQTSHEIYNYFKNANVGNGVPDTRSVLVRVIVSTDEESRNHVIKATNSQTGVLPASLRSTDKIHLDIEEYFEKNTLFFYDRKKNKYKNLGKKVSQIISISQMAQAVMSMLLGEPDTARARPASLLKEDKRYSSVFSEKYPLEFYRVSTEALKLVEATLLTSDKNYSAKTKSNLKFYALQAIAIYSTGSKKPSAEQISEITKNEIEGQLEEILALVEKCFQDCGSDDQAAKGIELKKLVETTVLELCENKP